MYDKKQIKILIVDDEPFVAKALARLLRGYDCTTCSAPEDALALISGQTFHLIISDYQMPNMDGVSLLTASKKLQPTAIRILLTGFADKQGMERAINNAEVFRFIDKPWNDLDFINAIERSLEHQRLLSENEFLANQVRQQQRLLQDQEAILQRLEAMDPGITKLNLDDDGRIVVNA